MTLSDIEGHSLCKPIQVGFFIQLCTSWQDLGWRGPLRRLCNSKASWIL